MSPLSDDTGFAGCVPPPVLVTHVIQELICINQEMFALHVERFARQADGWPALEVFFLWSIALVAFLVMQVKAVVWE